MSGAPEAARAGRGDLLFMPSVGGLWVGVAPGPELPVPTTLLVVPLSQLLPMVWNSGCWSDADVADRAAANVDLVLVDAVVPVQARDVTARFVEQYLAMTYGGKFDPATTAKFVAAVVCVAPAFARSGCINLQAFPIGGYATLLMQFLSVIGAHSPAPERAESPAVDDSVALAGRQFASVISSIANRAESPSLSAIYQGFVGTLAPGMLEDAAFADSDAAAKRVDDTAISLARAVKRRIDLLQMEESAQPKAGAP